MRERLTVILGHEYFVLLVRLALGGVLLYAGYQKATDLTTFIWTVEDYQVLPKAWAGVYGRVLPFGEMVVGALLILGLSPRLSGALAGLLILSFMIAMGQALVRGIELNCGCFGETTDPLTWWTVARDLPFLLGSAIVYRWGNRSTISLRSLWSRFRSISPGSGREEG